MCFALNFAAIPRDFQTFCFDCLERTNEDRLKIRLCESLQAESGMSSVPPPPSPSAPVRELGEEMDDISDYNKQSL